MSHQVDGNFHHHKFSHKITALSDDKAMLKQQWRNVYAPPKFYASQRQPSGVGITAVSNQNQWAFVRNLWGIRRQDGRWGRGRASGPCTLSRLETGLTDLESTSATAPAIHTHTHAHAQCKMRSKQWWSSDDYYQPNDILIHASKKVSKNICIEHLKQNVTRCWSISQPNIQATSLTPGGTAEG